MTGIGQGLRRSASLDCDLKLLPSLVHVKSTTFLPLLLRNLSIQGNVTELWNHFATLSLQQDYVFVVSIPRK